MLRALWHLGVKSPSHWARTCAGDRLAATPGEGSGAHTHPWLINKYLGISGFIRHNQRDPWSVRHSVARHAKKCSIHLRVFRYLLLALWFFEIMIVISQDLKHFQNKLLVVCNPVFSAPLDIDTKLYKRICYKKH